MEMRKSIYTEQRRSKSLGRNRGRGGGGKSPGMSSISRGITSDRGESFERVRRVNRIVSWNLFVKSARARYVSIAVAYSMTLSIS